MPGKVKTRLCPPCTPCESAEVAAAALADTLDAVVVVAAACGVRPTLLDGTRPPWVPAAFEMVGQSAGTLGDRLAHGFHVLDRESSSTSRCGRVHATTTISTISWPFGGEVGGRLGAPGATSGALADPSNR